MTAPALAVAGLTVLRDRPVLEAVDWTVRRGEHWVVLGANGSGKTTLLNCLAGYVTPGAGEVSVLGRRYGRSDWRELRRELGLVSSSLAARVDDGETALDVAASGRDGSLNYWTGAPAALRVPARAALRRVESAAIADRPWGVLSQGERQRVLIARAFMAGARLLILDEPCAGLDPAARRDFLSFLSRLARRKGAPAILLATHHVEEIGPFFTHALVLRRGRVLAAGPIRRTVASAVLGRAFGRRASVSGGPGSYRLTIG